VVPTPLLVLTTASSQGLGPYTTSIKKLEGDIVKELEKVKKLIGKVSVLVPSDESAS